MTWTERSNKCMEAEEYLVAFYLAPLMVIGCVSNTTSLIVFWIGRFRKNTFKIFAIAMALCDLITSVICVPVDMAYLLGGGLLLCKIVFTGGLLPPALSGLTAVLTSCDRYNRICKPLSVQRTVTRGRVELTVVTVIVAVVITAKLSFQFTPEAASNSTVYCFSHTVQQDFVIVGLAIVILVVSLIVMLWANCCIVMKLRAQQALHARMHPPVPSTSSTDVTTSTCQTSQERKSADSSSKRWSVVSASAASERNLAPFKTKTFVALAFGVITIAVAWIPYLTMRIVMALNPEKWGEFLLAHPRTAEEVLAMVSLRSIFIGGALNPFLYRFSDDNFRNEALRIWGCKKETEPKETIQHSRKSSEVQKPDSSQTEDIPSSFLKRTWSQSRVLEELALETVSNAPDGPRESIAGHFRRISEALFPTRRKLCKKSSTSVDTGHVRQQGLCTPPSGHFRLAAWLSRQRRPSSCVDARPQRRWSVHFSHSRFHAGHGRPSVASIVQGVRSFNPLSITAPSTQSRGGCCEAKRVKRPPASPGLREKDAGSEEKSQCVSSCPRPSISFDQFPPVVNGAVVKEAHSPELSLHRPPLMHVSASHNSSSSI